MDNPAHQGRVIVVDDEAEVRHSTAQTLELESYSVSSYADAAEALGVINRSWSGIIISDVRMPKMDGIEFLDRIIEIDADIPVVMVSAYADIPVAIKAIQRGAYDFVEKADDPDRLLEVVRRASEKRHLVMENRRLQQALDAGNDLESRLIGQTSVMVDLRNTVSMLANTDVDVLIYGETGVGKEIVARCLHDTGTRADRSFVALNCGALTESVIESELFGHEIGAFTGAVKQRIGKIEYADGGTLFLDEVESMPMHLQVKLLRVLQERNLERLGGNTTINVDLRVVAASKVDLRRSADEGRFREDLYYRLKVASISVPSLSHRREDIPLLFRYFCGVAAQRFRRPLPMITDACNTQLMLRTWPGNVRELRNVAECFVLGLYPEPSLPHSAHENNSLTDSVDNFERQTIEAALRAHGGRIENTALALGIPRKTLYLRMKKYALDRDDFR
ncbi:MAG: sigma-54-dependent Fis family transcriptional regulator [Gammaproteobacteria bacterium]|nr:sigma-54-dependent Fis family transcriptional regulator [Gammaproteobacteria bacterium]